MKLSPRIFIYGVLFITLLSITFFYFLIPKREQNRIVVKAEPVRNGSFISSISAKGKLSSSKKEKIIAPITGIITYCDVKSGQFVQKGKKLASLRLPGQEIYKIKQNLEFAKMDLEILSEQFENKLILLKAKAVSEKEVKEIRIQKYKQEKIVENYIEELKDKPIIAPISGLMVEKNYQDGDIVSAGTVICTLIDTSSYIVESEISQEHIPFIYKAQPVRYESEIFPVIYEGVVLEVSNISNNRNDNSSQKGFSPKFKVISSIYIPKDVNPFIGAVVETDFILSKKDNALFIPIESVLFRKDKPIVFIIKNDKAFLKEVKLGGSNSRFVEILSGLHKKDSVITLGNTDLEDGSLIISKASGYEQNDTKFRNSFPLLKP